MKTVLNTEFSGSEGYSEYIYVHVGVNYKGLRCETRAEQI